MQMSYTDNEDPLATELVTARAVSLGDVRSDRKVEAPQEKPSLDWLLDCFRRNGGVR